MAKASEKAYELVRRRIIDGTYPPASRLTEKEIADSSGVSRTPVREALQQLQSEGFVQVTANQGAVVVDWTASDAVEVYEIRGLLEPYAAARAAERATIADIEELQALAEAQKNETESREPGHMERIGALNSQFHRKLLDCARSTRLSIVMPMLIEAPLIMRMFTRYSDRQLVRSAEHHIEIVAALRARDPEWAAAIMRTHIYAARTRALPDQSREEHLQD
ncbi:GntR family transcriptional regulator [Elongatibacter sediminis]|uniref:GntR family transcriptional regulator n=1 Tax=Elongatibacter sediminis TaxID=3119006 RepID=A0AAW9RHK6_9GAMM